MLLIAEKYSDAKLIAEALKLKGESKNYFGFNGVKITWLSGHLLRQAAPEEYDSKLLKWSIEQLPFIPPNNELFLVPRNPSVPEKLNKLKHMIIQENTLVNCCDAGREGEYIFRSIIKYFNLDNKKNIRRMWLHSKTPEEIKRAYHNLQDSLTFDNHYKAASCRALGDWLVGHNLSRAVSLKYGFKLPIGRVLTPTLSILVKREQEILEFKQELYGRVLGVFKTREGYQYQGALITERGDSQIKDLTKADNIITRISGKPGIIEEFTTDTVAEHPPELYDSTSLEKDVELIGFPGAKGVQLIQEVYDAGLISYPRTSCRQVTKEMFNSFPKILQELSPLFKEIISGAKIINADRKQVVDDERVKEHYAIIPTGKLPGSELPEEKLKVFTLVVTRFIANFYPPAEKKVQRILTKVDNENFYSVLTYLQSVGWRKVYRKTEDFTANIPIKKNPLGAEVEVLEIKRETAKTSPPARYTVSELKEVMERGGVISSVSEALTDEAKQALRERGLGTPATRTEIIERLVQHGLASYVSLKKRQVIRPTALGAFLTKYIPIRTLISPEMTGEWEYLLNQVERGLLKGRKLNLKFVDFVNQAVKQVKDHQLSDEEKKYIMSLEGEVPVGECPMCKNFIYSGKDCVHCKSCKFIFFTKMAGYEFSEQEIKEVLNSLLLDPEGHTRGFSGFQGKKKTFGAALQINPHTRRVVFYFGNNEFNKVGDGYEEKKA